MNEKVPDFKGMVYRRFVWRRLKFECYLTNCLGETIDCWWEPEINEI